MTDKITAQIILAANYLKTSSLSTQLPRDSLKNETEVGTGTLESTGSIPVEVQGIAETSSQQENSPFTIKTKDYRVSPPPPRNFL